MTLRTENGNTRSTGVPPMPPTGNARRDNHGRVARETHGRDAHATRNRGSVLVMVIGMLTILFMLGATFLAVAHMNARNANAMNNINPREPLMEGVLTAIQANAAKERAALVSSVAATDIERMKAYADYPDDETRAGLASLMNTKFDSATARRIWWPHISNTQQLLSPTGTGPWINRTTYTTGGVYNPGVTFTGSLDATTKQWVWVDDKNGQPAIDTDGDGWADSVAIPTGVMNDHGERYYIAIRIIDTSGLFPLNNCANTYNDVALSATNRTRVSGATPTVAHDAIAGDTLTAGVTFDAAMIDCYVRVNYASPFPTLYGRITSAAGSVLRVAPSTPITVPGNASPRSFEVLLQPYRPGEFNIGTGGFLGSNNYHSIRTRVGGVSGLNWIDNAGLHLYSPDTSQCRPYGISDEVALRWGGTVDQGRIGPIVTGTYRALFTTYSVSPDIVRFPGVTVPAFPNANTLSRILLTESTQGDGTATNPRRGLDDPEVRARLLSQLNKIGDASLSGSTTGATNTALHILANLWAATSIDPVQNCSFGVGGGVYGAVEQLVVAEAYTWYQRDNPGDLTATPPIPAQPGGWVTAVELLNPTAVYVQTTGYRLLCGAGTGAPSYDLPSVNVEPGARVVVYDYSGNGTDGAPITDTDFGFSVSGSGTLASRAAPMYFRAGGVLSDFAKVGTTPISLYRTPGGVLVPLDRVTNSEIGYVVPSGTGQGGKWAQRDDAVDFSANGGAPGDGRPVTNRAMVAAWSASQDVLLSGSGTASGPRFTGQTLGKPNVTVLRNDAKLMAVNEGFRPVRRFGGRPMNAGDLTDLYLTGPETGDGNDLGLPQMLASFHKTSINRGRLGAIAQAVSTSGVPEVPAMALLSEIVGMASGDTSRMDELVLASGTVPTRMYGRININTAPREVLMQLPWPTSIASPNGGDVAIDVGTLVNYIIAYRDRQPANWANPITLVASGVPRDYSSILGSSTIGRQNPRSDSLGRLRQTDFPGFASAGEIAVPLFDYIDDFLIPGGQASAAVPGRTVSQLNGYLEARDSLYRRIAHLISVNSDSFAATITVQLRDTSGVPRFTWNYMMMFDRSNLNRFLASGGVNAPPPATLIFTRMGG